MLLHKDCKQDSYDSVIEDLVYVEKTIIYRNMDYKKHVPYMIPGVFTNGTVRY